jgi:hypothetical protein
MSTDWLQVTATREYVLCQQSAIMTDMPVCDCIGQDVSNVTATVNPYGLCVSCFLPVFISCTCFDTATPSTSAIKMWQHSSSWLPWHSSSSSFLPPRWGAGPMALMLWLNLVI